MTARKPKVDALLASFLAAPNAADAARIINVDGKRMRQHLRSKLGAYASKGTGWSALDIAARTGVFERFTTPVAASK
jgi:hypothetical protein